MWKSASASNSSLIARDDAPKVDSKEPAEPLTVHTQPSRSSTAISQSSEGSISEELVFKGVITGRGSLHVNGQLEGNINLPNERVTVGVHGQVSATITSDMHACITAHDIVVLGKVHGNLRASDRVDIRAEGSVIGDVTAARIAISDGAYFKGGIDLQKAQQNSETQISTEAGRTDGRGRISGISTETLRER
jgi:cytoskeletal protein CcmA (bactofilin family)